MEVKNQGKVVRKGVNSKALNHSLKTVTLFEEAVKRKNKNMNTNLSGAYDLANTPYPSSTTYRIALFSLLVMERRKSSVQPSHGSHSSQGFIATTFLHLLVMWCCHPCTDTGHYLQAAPHLCDLCWEWRRQGRMAEAY